MLTSLHNSANGAAQPDIAFAYDPLMRLASIDSTHSAFDVEFGYDGQEMVLEALSAGRTRRYVHGPGTDEPLVAYLVTPGVGTSRNWYQADERGSIVRLSTDSGTPGNLVGRYDEYGAGGTGRFRYTGQYWLGEANLLYYRARIYDPRLGRFLQPDPIGYGDGMNLYAYVGGDPVNFTDPLGLKKGGEKEDENQATVWGPGFGGGSVGGSGGGGSDGTPAEFLPLDTPLPGNLAQCGNAACDEAIVTAKSNGNSPFYFNGKAYRLDPYYRKPWWSDWFDRAVSAMFVGPAAVVVGVHAVGGGSAAVATSYAVTRTVTQYTFTRTVAAHIAKRPYMNSRLLINEIRATGKVIRDPGGVRGALRYDAPGRVGKTVGTWELVVHPGTGVIYHFLFRG